MAYHGAHRGGPDVRDVALEIVDCEACMIRVPHAKKERARDEHGYVVARESC